MILGINGSLIFSNDLPEEEKVCFSKILVFKKMTIETI